MKLNRGQGEILAQMKNYNKAGVPMPINGNAGTGKTTLIAQFIKDYTGPKDIHVVVPSHKAADCLKTKLEAAGVNLVHPPTTLHSKFLLRKMNPLAAALSIKCANAREDAAKNPTCADRQRLLENLEREYAKVSKKVEWRSNGECFGDCIVFFDEGSMVADADFKLCLEGLKRATIFVFGDNAQLPPPKKAPAFDFDKTPHNLTEIMRQGEGSSIIDLATHFRMKRSHPTIPASIYQSGEVTTTTTNDLTPADFQYGPNRKALVWTNQERRYINGLARQALGISDKLLVEGEEVIFYDTFKENGFYNGSTAFVDEAVEDYADLVNGLTIAGAKVTFESLDMVYRSSCTNSKTIEDLFATTKEVTTSETKYAVDYAYALSVHSSQGSEFDHVDVYVGNMKPRNPDYAKWFYTAVTRAKKSVRIITGAL